MTIREITIRLILITIFSGIVGYERERNNAHAGLKTHMLVGISATIIALIQQSIVQEALLLDVGGVIRSDPARLIAQVVSGIGFLGAGTIIVTKRNVSGLTTAASIWSVAGLGLSLGMGFYEVGIIGFAFIFIVLLVIRKLQLLAFNEKIVIEYVRKDDSLDEIYGVFEGLGLDYAHLNYKTRIFYEEPIATSVFEVSGKGHIDFEHIVSKMAKKKNIISVQMTNLKW